ncbi:MAG TPA: tetratricopeptide repeat protein [Candidatus Marinimicrobia bacterium]|nr:tetratricopeptide repeat protein [Candidatus Neomarinimicrobiota bacterium]
MKKINHSTLLFLALLTISCSRSEYPTTQSEQALELYKTGEKYRLQLSNRQALHYYLAAFETDSCFAMAAVKSAHMYLLLGEADSGHYFLKKARQLSEHKSSLERLIIEYNWADFNFDEPRRAALADSLVTRYPNHFEVRIIDAGEKWKRFRFNEARKAYQAILQDYPNYIIAYNNIGYLYAYEGYFKEAVAYLEKYKRYAPNQINPYDSLAEIYIAIGRYHEAIRLLEYIIANRHAELIQDEFLGVTIYYRTAVAYAQLGQYQKALDYLDEAEKYFTSKYAFNRLNRYRIHIYRELDQAEQVDKILQRLKHITPEEKFTVQTAIWHIMNNEIEKVLEILTSYKSSPQIGGNSKRSYLIEQAVIEGELNFKMGLYTEAAEKFRLAADTYADFLNSAPIKIRECIATGKSGDYSAALHCLHQQTRINPNAPQALVAIAEFYLKSDKKTEARAYLNHFFNLWKDADPGTPLLQQANAILDELNR